MNIISQDFKNVLKNKIKSLIIPNLYSLIDSFVDSLSCNINGNFDYLSFIYNSSSSMRDSIKLIIISSFEELDNQFKNSSFRQNRYFINKSNVPRTINTIFGPITFKRTYYSSKFSSKRFFFVDNAFNLPKYDHYDPIVKAIAINNSFQTSQAQSSRDISSFLGGLLYFIDKNLTFNIPRQSIFNWINNWHVPNIIPSSIFTPDTLYVMADEKYIGAQDIDKDIMAKCFVSFEDVKHVSKNRNSLSNRFVFSTCSNKPWKEFMDLIALRYDFSKLKHICLIGDGGSWIKSGINELRLNSSNVVDFYLCEFHFKQAIHHITSNKTERNALFTIFNDFSKKDFSTAIDIIIENEPLRADIIKKKRDYILNNYYYIKNMLNLHIGSSMESHISHLIASFFASRPKGFSTKHIAKYLKLNDYKNNNINIFNLYLKSYKLKKTTTISESYIDFSIFDTNKMDNIPILSAGRITSEYKTLNSLAHN